MADKILFTIIFSSRAQKEITKAWEWYEERQHSLGDRFIEELMSCVQLIKKTPERYPSKFKSYKETKISVFPFLIIYRLNRKKKSIRIVSVFHTSLNPRKKY